MKYLITENKIEKLIFSYLDNKNFIIKETDDEYYFLGNEDDDYAKIVLDKYDMICYIYHDLSEDIESFFSIEFPYSEEVLTRYVENALNVKVSETNPGEDDPYKLFSTP